MDRPPVREKEDVLPLGVRAAIVFLRVIWIAMFLPILLTGFATIWGLLMLVGGGLQGDLGFEAFVLSVTTFGIFLVIMMIASGCDWLARHLKASATAEGSTRSTRTLHPVRHIFTPPLGCLMIYSFLAVLAWLPSTTDQSLAQTWPWPVVWCALGLGAMYLFNLLDTKLP